MARTDRRDFINEIGIEAELAASHGNMRGVYSAIKKLGGEKHRSAPPLKDQNGNVLTT